jgi:membrane protease YdiL (CAAX protease family)
MTTSMTTAHKKILTFLVLTFGFSFVFYYLIASAGTLESGPILGLMWSPGVAALITQLIFNRSLRGLGWKPGKFKYLLLGYLLPVGYGVVSYGLVWLTGLGHLDANELLTQTSAHLVPMGLPQVNSPVALMAVYLGLVVTVGTVQSLLSATGEEIGWRGLLVPELSKVTTFTRTALISGAIWAVWHYPLILLANYHNTGAPVWFSLICFTVLVLSAGFIYAWLRLKSGSLWPAVLLHASHNLFIQNVFTPLTQNTGPTPYFIDEFGVILALVAAVFAFIYWRKRGEVERVTTAPTSYGAPVATTPPQPQH